MRVLGLMVLLALTGCQSPRPLDAAQAQCQAPVIALISTNWSERTVPNDTEDNFPPPKPATDWGENSIC
jgi:hypothetical protein